MTTIDDLRTIVDELQRENSELRNRQSSEPKVSLPAKYNGNKSDFRSFVSQVRLIFQLQPHRYHSDFIKTGFIGTLLVGPAASWFATLFETNSQSLYNLDLFFQEFGENFGDFDRVTVAANKIHSLRQGYQSASAYASDFRQVSCDLKWGEDALVDMFRRGLHDEVKDLLLTLPYPKTLNEAISFAVRCDNRLTERRMERIRRRSPKILEYPPFQQQQHPVPMEVDMANELLKFSKKLSAQEKERRRRENLCMYCGGEGHFVDKCPKKSETLKKVRVRPF